MKKVLLVLAFFAVLILPNISFVANACNFQNGNQSEIFCGGNSENPMDFNTFFFPLKFIFSGLIFGGGQNSLTAAAAQSGADTQTDVEINEEILKPDILISNVYLPKMVTSGEPVSFRVSVMNRGLADTPFVIRFSLPDVKVASASSTCPSKVLNPGEICVISEQIIFNKTGVKKVLATVDSNLPGASFQIRHSVPFSVKVIQAVSTKSPDIVVIYPSAASKIVKGKVFQIKWKSSNVKAIGINLNSFSKGMVAVISEPILAAKYQSFRWNVASDIPSGNDYFLIIWSGDKQWQSEPFAIVDSE